MLEIEDVRAGYGRVEVLSGVTFSVSPGASVGLFGRNGAGKTTLANTVLGLIKARGGDIRWDGRSLVGMRTEDIVKSGVSLVPQSRGLFLSLTVQENLVLSCAAWRLGQREVNERIAEVYRLFPALHTRSNLPAANLSGGQQQMLAIAKALIRRPRLLILDEPSVGLAPKVLEELAAVIQQLRSQNELTVILVEQNIKWSWSMVDEGFILEQGRIAENVRGTVQDAEMAMARHLGVG
jgi:branched-chain amino acid transport system ATP-binding protein